MPSDNFIKYQQLRERHPEFVYESFELHMESDQILIEFTFKLDHKAVFKPSLIIPVTDHFVSENLSVDKLNSFAFHIGMIELISYWKAACSPKIIIKPYVLDQWQVNWWRKLYYHGLGEFFYQNGITVEMDDFVEILSEGEPFPGKAEIYSGPTALVPIGGGKDSVVTLEMLKDHKKLIPFALNPRKAIWDTIINAGFNESETVVVNRKLDPELLVLNDEGYLNGHTPFSALLAFVCGMTAVLTGSSEIVLSNESSANEATVRSSTVNHQYSKSFTFEQDFRTYFQKYLADHISYFSFLRPWNELQIVRAFTDFKKHHPSFRSCNAGSKTDSWCATCSKCLFTFIMLTPFLSEEEKISIFGEDLFNKRTMIPILDELTGRTPEKPFECVGTIDEVNTALVASIKNHHHDLPLLLEYYKQTEQFEQYKDLSPDSLLNAFNDQHFLDDSYLSLLKNKA